MRKQLLLLLIVFVVLSQFAQAFDPRPGPISVDGTRAIGDLPVSRHVRNIGGSDGAGLCVYTSVQMAADWHQVEPLYALQKFASKRPGGSYPEKLDADITTFCASQGKPVPAYIQHVGGDESFLDLAMKTGRILGVTYAGVDGFYRTPVAHMVNLVHLDRTLACIVDNNRPGQFVWMTRQQFINRWRGVYDNGTLMTVRERGQTFQIGGGWAVCFLASPPPPYAKTPVAMAPEALEVPEVKNFGVMLKPLQPKAEEAPKESNFGVNFEKLKAQRKFTLNGTEVTKSVAEAAVLADDSTRFHLTFVGVPAPLLPETIRHASHVQSYSPDEWEVAQFGLKKGVTLRKPQTSRIGAEVLHLADYDTNAILAAISGEPLPVEPKPPLASITITEQDLTSDARQKLVSAGIGGFTLNVAPLAKPKPMPSKVEAAPEPTPVKKAVAVDARNIPIEAAPPGKVWRKPGYLHEPGEWTLEDIVPAASAPQSQPVFPMFNRAVQRFNCVNGVCR